MRINYGEIFQEKSKDRKMEGLVNIPNDSSLWPDSWKNVEYKEYTRFPKIKLPNPVSKDISNEILLKRRSCRDFSENKNNSITLQDLSDIIYYSCGEVFKGREFKDTKRIHSSAGARYPLEIYVLNFKEGELEKKCYHYNVKNHELEDLWGINLNNKKDINKYFAYEWSQNADCAIVITAIPNRSVRKYGERGYKYIYLEAGAVLQNMQNNAFVRGVGSVIMGGTNEKEIESLLDLDGTKETVMLGILLGK
jgi:SagB-type dehydrogenase family enzyme